MKKRIICLTLASCTILATFTGCEYKGEHSSFSVNFGDSEEIATPDSAQFDEEAETNSINMFIGMMGEPFYSSDMSVEELYASIGAFWVGHEVSHAFDRDGAQFDSKGDFRDWMPEADKAEFQKRIDKMDKYLAPEDRIVVW